MRKILLLLCLLSYLHGTAQTTKKEIQAQRISEAPVIDGKLNEAAWADAHIAKDFVMFRPGDGDPEPNDQRTEVKIIYDDQAIYVGAYLYDGNPDQIMRQLSEREIILGQQIFLP